MTYPKTIYVQFYKGDKEFWYNASENGEDFEDGQLAKYQLVKTLKKKTKITLE